MRWYLLRDPEMAATQTVEIDADGTADGSVIWLHGLGADGHDFEAIVPELALNGQPDLRFIFPHAPVRPVTINGGMSMRAWYDIFSLDRDGPQDESGIRDSGRLLVELIEREHECGVPYNKIVLAGFSQGGAIALHAAIRFPHRLAGLMALSTYLPLQGKIEAEVVAAAGTQSRELPVFMAHGAFDPMLPVSLGENSRDVLTAAGFTVEWRDYPMEHSLCAEEIADIRQWLKSIFAPQ